MGLRETLFLESLELIEDHAIELKKPIEILVLDEFLEVGLVLVVSLEVLPELLALEDLGVIVYLLENVFEDLNVERNELNQILEVLDADSERRREFYFQLLGLYRGQQTGDFVDCLEIGGDVFVSKLHHWSDLLGDQVEGTLEELVEVVVTAEVSEVFSLKGIYEFRVIL